MADDKSTATSSSTASSFGCKHVMSANELACKLEALNKLGYVAEIDLSDLSFVLFKSNQYTTLFKAIMCECHRRWDRTWKRWKVDVEYIDKLIDATDAEVAVMIDESTDRVGVRNELTRLCAALDIVMQTEDDSISFTLPKDEKGVFDIFITFNKYCELDANDGAYKTDIRRDVHLLRSIKEDIKRAKPYGKIPASLYNSIH
jgi:hypothetical protein